MPEVEQTDEGGTLSVPAATRGAPGPHPMRAREPRELVGRVLRRAGAVRPRAQRQHDDPRRHQHLGPPGTGRLSLGGDRPRPPDESHLAALAEHGGHVGVVLLTHHHLDHSEAAKEFAERMGCGVRALDPEYRLGSEGLGDGDVVEVDGLELHVVSTPGHTADSLSFVLPAEAAVLTGDTVLGRGTTVVAHPDGQLGAYLDSLDRLHALAESREIGTIWPGHGPVIDDALGALDYYIAHRAERLAQVESARGRASRPAAPRGPGRRRAAPPGGGDRLRRRRPGPVGCRRALGPCAAGTPGPPRLIATHGPRPVQNRAFAERR